jgi:hypothetical protein
MVDEAPANCKRASPRDQTKRIVKFLTLPTLRSFEPAEGPALPPKPLSDSATRPETLQREQDQTCGQAMNCLEKMIWS